MTLDFPDLEAPMPVYVKLAAPEISIWFREQEGYTFDGAGRPYAAFRGRRRYRRALDGRMIVTAWGAGPPHRRPRLVQVYDRHRAMQELDGWRKRLSPLLAHLQQGKVTGRWGHHAAPTKPMLEALEGLFTTVLAWDEARLNDDIARYHQVYMSVPILPPDQYLALYVQLTVGCLYNHCLFCDFYRDRPYRVRTYGEFVHHLEAVKAYFGPALAMRKRIFLGDANALHMEARALRQCFAILHRHFAIGSHEGPSSCDGIYSFIDAFTGLRLPLGLCRDLAAMGLRRVYLGFETGHEPLRRALHKPGHTSQVVEAVRRLKAAGISVGVIVLNGIGDRNLLPKHIRDTVAALDAMDLASPDIIFLSDLVVAVDSPYATAAKQRGWPLLGAEALLRQRLAFVEAIRRRASTRGVKITTYDVREFVY